VDVELRWCTADDLAAVARADGRAFGFHHREEDLADLLHVLDLERFLVATDAGEVVGVTGSFLFQMTLPGGASVAVPGVAWVSVQTTHRRRGVLTALLAEQHDRFSAHGHPMAILTASEGGIYGRFGYGPATVHRRLEVDRRRASLRRDVAPAGAVRLVEVDEARRLLPALHEAWRRRTPGALQRSDAWWRRWFLDPEHRRHGASARFYLVHDQGYAAYRVVARWNEGQPAHEVEIDDLFPATDDARAALWGHLLGMDLAGPLRTWDAPPDDPVAFLLHDVRQARTLVANDGLWVRLLDVPAALQARTYGVDGELVLEVDDPVWGRGGRFSLHGGPGGASCRATDAPAHLALGIGALASVYLGGHRLRTLARAGLVHELQPGRLHLADLMFQTERAPTHGTHF
jgi:predicted acetyltransferase